MFIGIASNVINVILNFLLVSGIGFRSLGFVGAPIATSLSRWSYLVMIIAVLLWENRKSEPGGRTMRQNLRESMKWAGVKQYLHLAIPSAFMMALESWCFSLVTILSSLVGPMITAANAIVLNVTYVTVMVPISVGVAAGVRIGNNIGKGDARSAKLACWMSFLVGEVFMAVNGLCLLLLRNVLATAFTDDAEIIKLVVVIFPLAALFQIFDGAQVVCSGVIRGMGRQVMGVIANFMGYYVIGLPVGAFLTFFMKWEETGLWWGLTIGLFGVSIALIAFLIIFVDWQQECEHAAKRMEEAIDGEVLLPNENGKVPNEVVLEDIMAEKVPEELREGTASEN
jgi:MATE family multidrug resistance protein